MKSRFFLLSILSVAALITVDAQQASAQGKEPPKERGARWSYAPNIYRIEQPRIPAGYDAPSTVRQGAMPQNSNFLGLDPGMLNSRPPSPVHQVAARPAYPQVSAKAFVPNTSYHPSFGQPVQPLQAGAPIQMAALPAPVAQGPSMAAPAVRHSAPAHRSVSRSGHKSVNATLLTPHKHVGQSASPAVAAYNTGYTPGGYLPAHSGSSNSVSTNVNGRIIRH